MPVSFNFSRTIKAKNMNMVLCFNWAFDWCACDSSKFKVTLRQAVISKSIECILSILKVRVGKNLVNLSTSFRCPLFVYRKFKTHFSISRYDKGTITTNLHLLKFIYTCALVIRMRISSCQSFSFSKILTGCRPMVTAFI